MNHLKTSCWIIAVGCIFAVNLNVVAGDQYSVFSVLTYNVQMRPLLDDNDHKAPRIGIKIQDYDIVALQESFAAKEDLVAHCSLPWGEHFTEKKCLFNLVHSGLSTLSQLPVVFTKKEHYRSSSGLEDIITAKGIMLTRYMINGLTLDVYNTHMQSTDGSNGHQARFDQARQLVNFVISNSPSTHSVIVLGDFNMSPMHIAHANDKFTSKHYDDEKDMVLRTYAFSMMQKSLGLRDLAEVLRSDQSDDIDRILFRSGDNHNLQPISIALPIKYFTDENKKPLSDGTPVIGMFSIDLKTEPKEAAE